MCGRVFLKSTLAGMVRRFGFADPVAVGVLDNSFPRYNGAPSLQYPIIVQGEAQTGAMFVSAKWGLVPAWQKEPSTGRPPPVNARSETIATNGMFKRAHASKRCLIPIDGYFEWKKAETDT